MYQGVNTFQLSEILYIHYYLHRHHTTALSGLWLLFGSFVAIYFYGVGQLAPGTIPKVEDQGIAFLSGSLSLTSLAWVALPVTTLLLP